LPNKSRERLRSTAAKDNGWLTHLISLLKGKKAGKRQSGKRQKRVIMATRGSEILSNKGVSTDSDLNPFFIALSLLHLAPGKSCAT